MAEHDTSSLAGRIQQRMDDLGLNAYSAARKAGLGDSFVRDILREKVKKPSADRLAKLAEALECSLNYLLGQPEQLPRLPGGDEGQSLQPPDPLANPLWRDYGGKPYPILLPIRYELMTGAFREAVETRRELGFEAASTVVPYADREQWFEVVRDESASLIAPPGSLLQVAKFTDKDRAALGEGDVVVIERHLIGPDAAYYMVERSVRIISERYPHLGLWFFEYACADPDQWGISDDIFRDTSSPEIEGDWGEEKLAAMAEMVKSMQSIRETDNYTGETRHLTGKEVVDSLRQQRKLRPRVVGKVLRAVVPVDAGASFGFTAAKKSGNFPK